MRDISTIRKEKYSSLNILLKDEYLLAHVDTAVEDVQLPKHIYLKRSVTLRVSRFFKGFIKVSEDKIVAELVFGEDRFVCHVPLDAIWGLTSMRGSNIVWPESAPPGLIDLLKNTGNLIKLDKESDDKNSDEKVQEEVEAIKALKPKLSAIKIVSTKPNEIDSDSPKTENIVEKSETQPQLEGKLPPKPKLTRIK